VRGEHLLQALVGDRSRRRLGLDVAAALLGAAPVPAAREGAGGAVAPASPLTPREVEVLGMLAEGLGNKQIAARLGISEHTVKFHVASIFTKLHASSRTEAVTIGARAGVILL
jgi:DNA-binding CsgD family transcriptional regulator